MPAKKIKEEAKKTNSIQDKLQGLCELQDVDSKIDKLKILRGELPLEVSDLESEIEKLNEHLSTQVDSGDELQNSIVVQKQKIEDANALIEKYNAQQMKVRNNREFDAINKELEFQSLEIELSNKKINSIELDVSENADKVKLLKATTVLLGFERFASSTKTFLASFLNLVPSQLLQVERDISFDKLSLLQLDSVSL